MAARDTKVASFHLEIVNCCKTETGGGEGIKRGPG
jgi:hypothetical protein